MQNVTEKILQWDMYILLSQRDLLCTGVMQTLPVYLMLNGLALYSYTCNFILKRTKGYQERQKERSIQAPWPCRTATNCL